MTKDSSSGEDAVKDATDNSGKDKDENILANTGHKVMTLAKRRGFFWSSNEIYGGSAGFFDYGPLGMRLECNLIDAWRNIFVIQEGFAEISTPVITPEAVFEASGHLQEFTDLMVECKKCAEPFRADLLLTDHHPQPDSLTLDEITDMLEDRKIKCPNCHGDLSEPYPFNLMFRTNIGPGSKRTGYLRPETAQGMFINFHLLYRYFREKVPFGIVQIGNAYRNEISPRQGMIRLREFKMAELEYFIDPSDKTHPNYQAIKSVKVPLLSEDTQKIEGSQETMTLSLDTALLNNIIGSQVMAYFIALTYRFLTTIGLPESSIRFRQHMENEKAHYAEDCWDAEILTSYGWIECVGIADRSCYDIERHNQYSGHTLAITIHHDEPIEKEVERIIVDKSLLGKEYKALAVRIRESLESLEPAMIPEGDGPISITIDGIKYEIDRKYFAIKKVVEKEFGKKIIPHVIEPSFGLDRILFALIENAYYERDNGYRVLRFKQDIAPIGIGIFPLMAKPELIELSQKCLRELKNEGINTYYDESASIGRRYARMDEAGTPFCVTIDYDSLEKNTVTIRERDSADQVRVKVEVLPRIIKDLISGKITFQVLVKMGE